MGNECSRNSELNIASDSHIDILLRPKDATSFTSSIPALTINNIPLLRSDGDVEAQVQLEDFSPMFGGPVEHVKEHKNISRFQSNDIDKVSQEETNAPQSKKAVSFFHCSSLENQSNPIEISSQARGDDWSLENIKLDTLIRKENGKYLWEASNTVLQKKCAIKVTLIENSKLLNSNLSRAEVILRELNTLKHPHVTGVHSFSIWESEIKGKPCSIIVIVQEMTKCTLRDVQTHKIEKGTTWNQNQVMAILHDMYSGLVACKERQITHGRLRLENVLFSEDMQRAMITDFDLKLPMAGESRPSYSPGKSIFAKHGNQEFNSAEAEKLLSAPAEKDIQSIVSILMKMMTMDENAGIDFEELKKDERYKRTYQKVFDALEVISKRIKSPSMIIKDLEKYPGVGEKRLGLTFNGTIESDRTDSRVDTLFTKIDCYELINHHESAKEVYSELLAILDNKDIKGQKECEEYIRCVNKTIKHYLATNNWLKAKEVSNELSSLLKKDQSSVLKKMIKVQPREYISFILLLGNICEGLNEPEKAIGFYTKALGYCARTTIDSIEYSSTLKNLSKLYIKRKEYASALEQLKKLAHFYETQEELSNDKAETYINIGDILTLQDHPEQAVKFYLKSIDNLKSGKANTDVEKLEVLKKIVNNYKNLKDNEETLLYLLKAQDLKKSLYGNDSQEYLEAIKELGDMNMGLKNYQSALNFYQKYNKICTENGHLTEGYVASLNDLGNCYGKLRKYQKAAECYQIYSEMKYKANGKQSKEYIAAQDKLADIAFREKQYQRALEIQQESFAIKEKMYDANDLYMLISLSNIGDTYLAKGQYEKALESHQECLTMIESKPAEFKDEHSKILLKIAYDYEKLGNGGQAIDLVHKSFQARDGRGVDMEKTVEAYEMLSKMKETQLIGLDFSGLNKSVE